MSSIKPSISGPKRPQDLILLSDAKQEFQASLTFAMTLLNTRKLEQGLKKR